MRLDTVRGFGEIKRIVREKRKLAGCMISKDTYKVGNKVRKMPTKEIRISAK